MNHLNFSPEQFGHEQHLETPAAAIEAELIKQGVSVYIANTHTVLQGNPTYESLHSVYEIINAGYSQRQQLGQAFIDGVAVGLDIIQRYDPNIQAIMGTNTAAYIESLHDDHYHPNTIDDIFSQKRMNFIVAVSKQGEAGYKQHGTPYERVLSHLYHTYPYKDQQRTLQNGMGFVLDQAQRAQADDLESLEQTVRRHDAATGRHLQPLAEIMAEQAMKAIDEQRSER